jgi:hypothetical protein
VESIEASHHDPRAAYVAFDGHHSGDFRPHLFKTTDYGQTWTRISSNLPEFGHINVVRDDPHNPRLLYVGTETGFFVSLDGGAQWTRFMNNLPAVICDDLVVHPRENDLVLATHGRSFFVLDDITPLQQLNDEVLSSDIHLFTPRSAVAWHEDRTVNNGGGLSIFRAANPVDGTYISYYLKDTVSNVRIEVIDVRGQVIRELAGSKDAGINRVAWDLRKSLTPEQETLAAKKDDSRLEPERILGDLVTPGIYVVKLTVNGRTLKSTVQVLPHSGE